MKRLCDSIARRRAAVVAAAAFCLATTQAGKVLPVFAQPPGKVPVQTSPAAPPGLVVNAESATNDSKPSLAILPDGRMWMVWHGYANSKDRVLARQLHSQRLGPVHELSEPDTSVQGAPLIVAVDDGAAWAFWSTRRDGRWRLMGRELRQGKWQAAVALSGEQEDALMPAVVRFGRDRLLLTWSAYAQKRFRIRYRMLEKNNWTEPVPISSDRHDSFRPAVAANASGDVWVFWDSYQAGNYAVRGRPILPKLGSVEQISPAGENCLLPTALAAKQGLCVAWLQAADVSNAQGALGQLNTMHLAIRGQDGWQLARDAEGNSIGAACTHGLTAKMEPKPAPKLGHMGRLRVPMLLEDGDAVWLLWERKTVHSQHPARSHADLAARPCRDGKWAAPVILQSGRLDYHLSTDPRAQDGKFIYLASRLPMNQRRIYERFIGDVNRHTEFQQDRWTGYKPVKLPLQGETRPRHEIRADGKTYRLYWADLHNHSGLTCDAHGEPDELFHYARDRARLDVVSLTDNDDIFDDPLTEAEYALSCFFAKCFTRPGEFLALPGYEWTSHVPNSKEVDRADPRNWDFRWHARNSHNNHRTVVYPASGGPLLRHTEIGNNIEQLCTAVEAAGGVVFPHHRGWDPTGHPAETNVEVTSAWGIYITNPARIHRALNQGYRFGFAGNSDSHRRNPGLAGALTAVYAEGLTSEAILEALRHRRIYATNGSWIVLDSRANGALMGREVRADDGRAEITLLAIGTRPITAATLIRDGKEVKTFTATGRKELRAVYKDEQLPKGTHWYYWRVAQEGQSPQFPGNVCVARGHLAWSSPHWVIVP